MAAGIAACEEADPSIVIEYEAVPFGQLNEIVQARIGSGDAIPDVYTADQPRIPALAESGLLMDLTDKVSSLEETVLESSIEASSWDGRLYALPVSTSTQLLFYNETLLEQAGIEPPGTNREDRWTWARLTDAAQRAQEAGAKWGFMFDQVSRYYQYQPIPESLGAGSGLQGPKNLEPTLTSEGHVTAAEFYGQLFADGLAPRGIPPEQSPDLFANGDVAFFVGGPWRLPLFNGSDGLSFGVAPHPYFSNGEPVTPTDAWSWGINPNTQHPEEALAFIKCATLTEQGALATATGHALPPAHIEALETYLKDLEAAGPQGVADLMRYELDNTAVHRPRTVGYIQFETVMGRALEDIRNGADAAATLQAAQRELESLFERL
jgi:multiple sugar transport system substrate-binding protein